MWTRELGDDRTEVVTVSWWENLEVIKGFAGDDIAKAVYYPADEGYLLAQDDTVRHFEVSAEPAAG
jgi:heme-degrading monooxygenase HmoA